MKKQLILCALILSMNVSQAAPVSTILGKVFAYSLLSFEGVAAAYHYKNMNETVAQHTVLLANEQVESFIRREIAHVSPELASTAVLRIGSSFICPETMVACSYFANTIIFNASYYEKIAPILAKSTYTQQEQEDIDVLCFIIQHEANHIKHNDPYNRLYRAVGTVLPKIAVYEWISSRLYFTYSSILTFLAVNGIANMSRNMSYHAQEFAADAAVVTQQAQRGGMIFFKRTIEQFKTNPLLEMVDRHNGTHPSVHDRLSKMTLLCMRKAAE